MLENSNIQNTCASLIEYLKKSVKERIAATPKFCKNCLNSKTPFCTHAKIGILFSGGIDCTILAILTDRLMSENGDPIDLLNVSFEKLSRTAKAADLNFDSPDRLSAKQTVNELQKLSPNRFQFEWKLFYAENVKYIFILRKWNLVEINITRKEMGTMHQQMLDLMYPLKTVLDESIGTALWYAASGDGTVNGIPYRSPCRVRKY